jgi:hypothetical protein
MLADRKIRVSFLSCQNASQGRLKCRWKFREDFYLESKLLGSKACYFALFQIQSSVTKLSKVIVSSIT